MGMSSFLISGTMQQFCGLSSTALVFGDSSQSKPARNAWCRHIVPFCKELGSDNLTQECQLGGSLAGKLSARVLSIALSFLCASLHSLSRVLQREEVIPPTRAWQHGGFPMPSRRYSAS